MFDAVLSKSRPPRGYLPGFGLALLVYTSLIGGAVWMVSHPQSSQRAKPDVTVTLFAPLRVAPPPPPPAAAPEAAKLPKRPKPIPRPSEQPLEHELVQQTPVEPEKPEADTSDSAAPAAGVPGGVPGGVAGGAPGGVVGGVLGGTGTQVLPFGAGMTRPSRIAGEEPRYSAQATAARVEGKVLVRCVITVTGELRDCQVIKPVPLLTEVVLSALRNMRFTPVYYLGHPQAIQYLFTYTFKLP